MQLTTDQARVFRMLVTLEAENAPVILGALHDALGTMDVRDLFLHLEALLDLGLIENAWKTPDKIGNAFRVTARGWAVYRREPA